MATITMTFDVPDVDPTLIDPLDIAGEIVDTYNEWCSRAQGSGNEVAHGFLEAEWD